MAASVSSPWTKRNSVGHAFPAFAFGGSGAARFLMSPSRRMVRAWRRVKTSGAERYFSRCDTSQVAWCRARASPRIARRTASRTFAGMAHFCSLRRFAGASSGRTRWAMRASTTSHWRSRRASPRASSRRFASSLWSSRRARIFRRAKARASSGEPLRGLTGASGRRSRGGAKAASARCQSIPSAFRRATVQAA